MCVVFCWVFCLSARRVRTETPCGGIRPWMNVEQVVPRSSALSYLSGWWTTEYCETHGGMCRLPIWTLRCVVLTQTAWQYTRKMGCLCVAPIHAQQYSSVPGNRIGRLSWYSRKVLKPLPVLVENGGLTLELFDGSTLSLSYFLSVIFSAQRWWWWMW